MRLLVLKIIICYNLYVKIHNEAYTHTKSRYSSSAQQRKLKQRYEPALPEKWAKER